jgi:hypothetical protein
MKTPREILLRRHQAAESKLDAIRNEVVAEHVAAGDGEKLPARTTASPAVVVMKLWQELVWPSRRIWAGIAAVWVVIIALRMTEPGTAVQATAGFAPQTMVAVLSEQRRELAQLLGENSVPQPALPPQPLPQRPRSERRANAVAV